MRRWFLLIPVAVLLALGCARPADPVLRPGDVVRPEVAFAPKDPWPAGAEVAIGMLVQVERPGGETHYLRDTEVAAEQAAMRARVTFLDGDLPLGNALEVPFVRDC
jgi:hypothetical protein